MPVHDLELPILNRSRFSLFGLLALLIAASCGGSEGQVTATTEAEATVGAVTSADGLLTVTPPAGSGPITIDVVAPEEGVIGVLGIYELGPDGAQFDEPVQVEFRVTSDDLAGGVFGVVESADGSVEGLILELVDSGDGRVVRTSLDHFSRMIFWDGGDGGGSAVVRLEAPLEVTVGARVPLELVAEETRGSFGGLLVGDLVVHDADVAENWLINPPLEGTPPNAVICTAPGTPFVKVDGVFDITWHYGDSSLLQAVVGTFAISQEAQITCVKPTPIKHLDFKCLDAITGFETISCTVPEVSIFGTDPAEFRIGFDYPAADLDVGFSLFMNFDESNPVLIERHSDGRINGFYGLGFASFPPGEGITGGEGVDTETGSSFVFLLPSLSLDPATGAMVFTVESGGDVEGGPRIVTDITIFVEIDDKFSITLLDMADIINGLTE
jgi:hypothetical protein